MSAREALLRYFRRGWCLTVGCSSAHIGGGMPRYRELTVGRFRLGGGSLFLRFGKQTNVDILTRTRENVSIC